MLFIILKVCSLRQSNDIENKKTQGAARAMLDLLSFSGTLEEERKKEELVFVFRFVFS